MTEYRQLPLDVTGATPEPSQAPRTGDTSQDDFHDLYRFENANRDRLGLPEVSPQEFRQINDFFDYGRTTK